MDMASQLLSSGFLAVQAVVFLVSSLRNAGDSFPYISDNELQ